MTDSHMLDGTVHKVPKEITLDTNTLSLWNNLTPLGRNEWICWAESAKKVETRQRRINRITTELLEGKRRPCCWAGCSHRQKLKKR